MQFFNVKNSSNYTENIRCHDIKFSPLLDLAPGFVYPNLKISLHNYSQSVMIPDFVV